MKKILCLILLLSVALSACGKKGNLKPPADRKKPKFDNVTDEQ